MNKTTTAVLGALALGVLGLTASGATADVPDAAGEVHGCYRPSGLNHGELLLVDTEAGETCPADYEALSWSTTALPNYEVVTGLSNGGFTATATCPTGKTVVSGGHHWDGIGVVPGSNFHLMESRPLTDGSGWIVAYQTSGPTVDVYAVCVSS